MKLAFIALFLTFFSSFSWLTNFDQAKKEAHSQNKFILLNFSGSDWCAPCIKLKKDIFNGEDFKMIASNRLVLLSADFPRLKKNQLSDDQIKQNEFLAEKYNKQGKFPLTVLMDYKGNVLRTWEGYPTSSEDFLNDLKRLSGYKK